MFTKSIVKIPCENMIRGLTSVNLGIPNYLEALVQHQYYINALRKCGLEVTILDADENYPDSAR